MEWTKLGLIFSPSGSRERMRSHAALPTSLSLRDGLHRIYFASRDERGRSHVWFADFDLSSPREAVRVSPAPVLAPGPLGHFDDHGVFPASLVEHERKLYMYYIGWNPGGRAPLFYSSIGLAVSDDGGETFRKAFQSPVMARSEFDPCLVTSPCVVKEGEVWRMWYVSGFKWEEDEEGLRSYYHVKYAESHDGVQWRREGLVCLDLKPGERNIARPCVIKDAGLYKAWYSYNCGDGYRLGYAESEDGRVWRRLDDEVGLDVSDSGWDSKALAYPWVFSHEGRKYILYNGNDFGREGFGLAASVE